MNAQNFISDEYVLMKGLAGSHSYGTNIASSDVDYRGIFCPDRVNIMTPFFPVREVEDSNEEDTKFYEMSHFMKLCLDCNPNIIEMLWVDDEDITFRTPAYDLLREHRSKLLSSKIAFTTSGYALSQLKRIKGHNKWLNAAERGIYLLSAMYANDDISTEWLNLRFDSDVVAKCGVIFHMVVNSHEVKDLAEMDAYLSNPDIGLISNLQPRQIDFVSLVQNFTDSKIFNIVISSYQDDHRLIPYGHNIFGMIESEGSQIYSDDYTLNRTLDSTTTDISASRKRPKFILKFNNDEYQVAKERYKNYNTWKKNRNVTRSSLEEHHGYDTKHAMHLVRLLRMGVEALNDGVINVKRSDAAELLEIRDGKWGYDQLVSYAEEMDAHVRGQLYKTTDLPKKPNIAFAAELLMEAQELAWDK